MNRKSKKEIKLELDSEKMISQRFVSVSAIFILLYCLVFLFIFINFRSSFFVKTIWFLNTGVFIWFFSDYEILRSNSRYLFALMIAILIVLYSYYIQQIFQFRSFAITFPETTFALVFLLIQWPIRKVFQKLFKTEPEVNRIGKVKNILYTIILIISTFIIVSFL
jgi:hypothetical protein